MIVDGERTGRRILALFLVMALISALPVFSFADGEEVVIKDSGSPMVSMMAMRAIAADEGISLVAAEGNSGQFGYNYEPYQGNYSITYSDYTSSTGLSKRAVIRYDYIEPGSYSWTFKFDHSVTNCYWRINSTSETGSYRANSKIVNYNLDISEQQAGSVAFTIYCPVSSFDDFPELTVLSEHTTLLVPVDGISCGWSVHEALSQTNTRDRTETFTWNFGSLPAGNYLLNIYHYGVSFGVDWDICVGDSVIGEDSRFIPISSSDSLSVGLVSHSGGELILSGTGNFFHSLNSGYTDFSGSFSEYNGSGSISLDGFNRVSWLYSVTDVIVVPLDGAGLEQFGVFGPVVGFLRDQFASLKFFLSSKFDKDEEAYTGATSSELSQDITSTEQLIQQEHQFTESINTQITEQSSKVDPVTVLDGIEGSSSVFSSMLWVSSIVSSGIDSMGVFQFLIYVPMILGVVTLVIGRGASLAGRRPRSQAAAVIRVYDRRRK